jgi:hypothetical protein
MVAASGASTMPRSVSITRWQLPPPFSRTSGQQQRVPIAADVEGSCLDTVTGVQVQSREGELWQGRITERPMAPSLDLAEPVGSGDVHQQQQQRSWAQWMMGLVVSRQRSPSADGPSGGCNEAQQTLRMRAAIPYQAAQSLMTQPSGLDVRLRSDFVDVPVALELQPRRVWIIAEQAEVALTFLSQLPMPPANAASAQLKALTGCRRSQHDSALDASQSSAQLMRPSRAADIRAAAVSGLSLRKPIATLAELQRRVAAGIAAVRQSQPVAMPPISGYGWGLRYEAIAQAQPESIEARLQGAAALLQQHRGQQQHDHAGSAGQLSRLVRKLRFLAPLSAATPRRSPDAVPDAVLILLQPAARVVSGAAAYSSASPPWSCSRHVHLEQLIVAAASANVPVLVVLSGTGLWSPLMGADLTAWARSGASVLHVESLSGDPDASAKSSHLIQHAVYRLLADAEESMLPSRSKL